jgi:gamma-glutamyl AIG2-like cyclotransferase
MADPPPTYYFAYGSNISTTQMLDRCPSSTPLGLAHLSGWTFQINERGYANILHPSIPPSPPIGIYGMLYRLDPTDEQTLDFHEFVPINYQKHYLRVTIIYSTTEGLSTGMKVDALVYVSDLTTPGEAGSEYIRRMNRGIDEAGGWCMPPWYVFRVLRPYIPEGSEQGDRDLWEGEDDAWNPCIT